MALDMGFLDQLLRQGVKTRTAHLEGSREAREEERLRKEAERKALIAERLMASQQLSADRVAERERLAIDRARRNLPEFMGRTFETPEELAAFKQTVEGTRTDPVAARQAADEERQRLLLSRAGWKPERIDLFIATGKDPQEKTADDVNWSTVVTDEGIQQVHPRTGATRQTGLRPPPREPRPPSAPEVQAGSYARRMETAEEELDKIKAGTPTVGVEIAGRIPLIGAAASRRAETTDQQRYRVLASDWIRAKLRKESGAAIGEKEMRDEFETYFAQPGDDPLTMELKKQRRKIASEEMRKQAGTPTADAAPPPSETREQRLRRLGLTS